MNYKLIRASLLTYNVEHLLIQRQSRDSLQYTTEEHVYNG